MTARRPASAAHGRWQRLGRALRTDLLLQARAGLYPISAGVSILTAALMVAFAPTRYVEGWLPGILLLFAGGSTLIYVVAMVLLERADGTLDAASVSPLRPSEYLGAKVLSLTTLGTAESALMGLGAVFVMRGRGLDVPAPHLLGFAAAAALLAAVHVLAGAVIAVRHRDLLAALLPTILVAILFQLPALWCFGAVRSPAWMAIPSGPPTLLMRAAFAPLSGAEWALAVGGTGAGLAGLFAWAHRAYLRHVVERAGT